MATTYRRWLQSLATAPLGGEYGDKLLSLYGLVADTVSDLVTSAVEARSLYSARFPLDALRYVGSERGMPRYPEETDLTYTQRLKGAWRAYSQGGTAAAVVAQLAAAGLVAAVKENHSWDWDSYSSGASAIWTRFWCVFTGHPFQPWTYGSGYVWGGGQTWGSTATPSQLGTILSIVRKWKAAHARLEHLILVFDPLGWEAVAPGGDWDDPAARPNNVAVFIPTRQDLE